MFGVGLSEILLVLMLVVIFLGANRLPDIGRSLGDAMREMRKTRTSAEDPDADREETP